MKFYCAGSKFFEMKNDADKHRRELGLKPSDLHTLTITNRTEICEFLNGLVSADWTAIATPQTQAEAVVKGGVHVEPEIVPSYVPEFLLSAEQKKQRAAQKSMERYE